MQKNISPSLKKAFFLLKHSIKSKNLSFKVFFNYLPQKPNLDYVNYLSHLPTTLPNTVLRPLAEDKQILDFDDKFGLGNIKDPKVILNHLEATNYSYSFNDLRYFLKRLQQINEEKPNSPALKTKLDQRFKKFVNEIKSRLRNNDHETYPYIGTYAYCLMRLNVQDSDLWGYLEEKIKEDQFYTNFKEATFACEGFVMLNMFNDQKRIDDVYKRLERIVNLTIWEVNMLYYKRIAESLVAVNRYDSTVFAKLEQHIMRNLSMDYELETMVSILLSFYKSRHGSKDFYRSMQLVLTKGHMFNKNPLIENRLELPFSGELIANIVEIYSDILDQDSKYQLDNDFCFMLYKMITNKKMNYALADITKIIRNIDYFRFEDEKILISTIINKIPLIDFTISFIDIENFFDLVIERNIISAVPDKVKFFLEEYVIDRIPQSDQGNVFKIYSYLMEKNLVLSKERLNYKIIEYLNQNVYKIEPKMIRAFLEKVKESDEKMVSLVALKQIHDVLYLDQLEKTSENKNLLDSGHKKNL